jgi:hypothetical protein
VATFSSVTRQHVLAAIAEHDTRGEAEFLALYGFEPSGGTLAHEGRRYDARAILGVAHRYATGRLATTEEFHGDLHAIEILRRRGFEVTAPPSARGAGHGRTAARTAPGGRTAASRPRRASRASVEAAPAICPTCLMALPATGVCDTCG